MKGKFSILREILSSPFLMSISNESETDLSMKLCFVFPSTNDLFIDDDNIDISSLHFSDVNKFSNFDFRPMNPVLDYISRNAANCTPQCVDLYAKYCLFSYVKIIIDLKDNLKSEVSVQLLRAFTQIRKSKFQNMVNGAFIDLLADYLRSFDRYRFDMLFPLIFEFFQSEFEDRMFIIFPEILQKLIQEYGFELNSLTAQFTSLTQIILVEYKPDSSIVSSMFKLCNPFFIKLNDSALNLLCYLTQYLDENQIDAFFLKFPFCFESYIDSDKPLFKFPDKQENPFQINPIQSPVSLSSFENGNLTFPNGVQLFEKSSMIDPSSDLMKFIRPDIHSKINTVLKILESNIQSTKTFLISFNELIRLKADTPSCFDYISMYVHILSKIPPNNSLDIPIPSILFCNEFAFSRDLHILRYIAIKSFLNFDLKCLESLLRDLIKFPFLMSEIGHIFYSLAPFVNHNVKKNVRFLRVFKEIGAAYQYEDVNGRIERDIIEIPRNAFLSFFSQLFQIEELMSALMKDAIILQFFIAHLFEENLQDFIFEHMGIYIGTIEASDDFVNMTSQLFMQIVQLLPDDRGLKLLIRYISTILKHSKNLKPFSALNDVLCKVVDKLEFSVHSKEIIDEILTLLITESISEIEIPQSLYSSIERTLMRFNDPNIRTFERLNQLMAGTFISGHSIPFDIRNFSVINLLFSIFKNATDDIPDIFEYSAKLCRYSYMNCVGCHNCGFDALLIDYLYQNRDIISTRVKLILSVVSEIVRTVSSPAIVQQVVSLFTPIDSQYITSLHPVLVKALRTILDDELNAPPQFISLTQCHHIDDITMDYLYNGFSFFCWIYIDHSTTANIVSIKGNAEPLVSLMVDKQLIYINQICTYVQISKRKWTFIAISVYGNNNIATNENNVSIKLYHDSVKIKEVCVRFEKLNAYNFSCDIGSVMSNSGRLGHFGLYPLLNSEELRKVYFKGPRLNNSPINIQPYYIENDFGLQEAKTFPTILLQSFRVETFLPLFAQLDFPLKSQEPSNFDVIDLVFLLDATFSAGFNQEFDFSVLSHLLSHSSCSHLTLKLYQSFCTIHAKLKSTKMKKDIIHNILMNFNLWYTSANDEHIQILKEMKKMSFITDLSNLLITLRVFYWYAPIEIMHIGGSADRDNGKRPRDSALDVKTCRKVLLSAFDSMEITENHFSLIITHCFTISDTYQVYDLLDFLKNAKVRQIRLDKFRVSHFLFNNKDDTIICLTISTIISLHKQLTFENFSLIDHIGQIFIHLASRKFSGPAFLESLIGMLPECPELFELCSYLAMCRKDSSIYYRIRPSANFCARQCWPLWSVVNAITLKGEEEVNIFNFLIECNHNEWLNIFDSIRIASTPFGFSFHKHRMVFLIELSQYILKNSSNISEKSVSTAFSMIVLSILFRRLNQNSEYISKYIRTLFENSPFAEEVNRKHQNLNENESDDMKVYEKKKLKLDDISDPFRLIIDYPSKKLGFTFGLKVNKIGEWADIELAVFALSLTYKFQNPRFYCASFLIATYLLKSNEEFIKSWVEQMKFSEKERENNFEYFEFFLNRIHGLRTPLPEGVVSILDGNPVKNHYLKLETYLKTIGTISSYSNISFENVIDKSMSEVDEIQFESEANLKKWEKLWRNMSIIGGPWHFSQDQEPKWKRDFASCAFHCPMKLKKNKHFDIHLQASLTREIGNASDAEKIVREYRERLEFEYRTNSRQTLMCFSDDFDQNLNRSASINSIMQSETFIRSTSMPKMEKQNQPNSNHKNHRNNNIHNNKQIPTIPNLSRAKLIKCELIKATKDVSATFSIIDRKTISIITTSKMKKIYDIPLKRITEVFLRKRFHHLTAMEMFLFDGRSYFVNFPEGDVQSVVYNISIYSPNLNLIQKTNDFSEFFAQQNYTARWSKGVMSNFEYLMKLNIFSGRSFNDISLYPFFPWVVGQFNSGELDINNPDIFRDLTKPIGAIGEARIAELRERMAGMVEAKEEVPYLYFAYVICPLAVFLYLIRMEPFTSLHIKMQSGKFDQGSRIFASIADSYNSATTSLNNYRELPADFFFCPEALINENGFDFGKNKNGNVDDVVLPVWANKSPFEFVYKMRKALESDYVSESLSSWIDLIWGYKQRGEEAIKADNKYSEKLYDSVWTPETLQNPNSRAEIEATLCHVGQVPPQIFRERHVVRRYEASNPLFSKICIWNFEHESKKVVLSSYVRFSASDTLVLTVCNEDKTWRIQCSIVNETVENVKEIPLTPPIVEKVKFFADESCYILQSGKLKHPFKKKISEKTTFVKTKKIETDNFFSNYRSSSCNNINYEAVVVDHSTLRLFGPYDFSALIPFYGEDIKCVDISPTFKTVVCGTASSHIFICSLFDAVKINAIELEKGFQPLKILITDSWGFIVCYAESSNCNKDLDADSTNSKAIFVFNINGRLIRKMKVPFAVSSWFAWTSRKAFDYVVVGTTDGRIYSFEIFYFELNDNLYRAYSPIKAITYIEERGTIAAVTENSHLVFIPIYFD